MNNLLECHKLKIICKKVFSVLHFSKCSFFNFKTKKEYPFTICKPKQCEFDIIVREMYRSYYPDEPVSFALRFRCDPKLDEIAYEALNEGLSVIAKCKYSGDIVATAINQTTNPWDPNFHDRLACTLSSSGKSLLHIQAHLMRAHQLWEYYNVDKIFDIRQIFVKREERKMGIPTLLVKASRDIAADCGYQVVRVISTNGHRVCEKLHFHRAYELPYCAYIGADYKPVVEPPPPHFAARVYLDAAPHVSMPDKIIEKDSEFLNI